MLLVSAVAAAWAAEQTSPDREDEHSFTTLDTFRKKPGYDPNLYNDTSHEMYEED